MPMRTAAILSLALVLGALCIEACSSPPAQACIYTLANGSLGCAPPGVDGTASCAVTVQGTQCTYKCTYAGGSVIGGLGVPSASCGTIQERP